MGGREGEGEGEREGGREGTCERWIMQYDMNLYGVV